MLFKAIEPVGARCTRNFVTDSGDRNHWLNEVMGYREEMAALRANALDPRLSPSEHADYWAQVVQLHAHAAAGVLRFSGRKEEAKPMNAVYYVIEMRPLLDDEEAAFGRPARLVRVYFAEPAPKTDVLLGLHVGTKENGPDQDHEQTASVREAGRRAEQWAGEDAAASYR